MENNSESIVYIVGGKRTPIGCFQGKLSKYTATDLGGFAINASLKQAKILPTLVDEVILGNVVSAGVGQAPAKQSSVKGGLPFSTPCTTINKVCSSGMKSIMMGCQSIKLGDSQIVVAGGFESMSNAPFYLNGHRKGHSFGQDKLIDGVAFDGLTDSFRGISMGLCAQKTANDFGQKLGRQKQDQYALLSYKRTIDSVNTGRFASQICPLEQLKQDQQYKRFNETKFKSLKTVFKKQNGTITAGNASKLNDGACSVILASELRVKELGLQPLAKIISYADAETDSVDFCIAPQMAIIKALSKIKLPIQKIDYFQINEAFAATVLANIELLKIPVQKMNIYGGAISLGHPIGMSGGRIVLNLAHILKDKNGRYGVASVCNGGGGASAIVLERV